MLGCELRWGECSGLVVETEAYTEFGDQASHAFFRRSTRQFLKDHAPGALYVYLNYGIHWLLNFLVAGPNENGFVLVRALEPKNGIDRMRERRGIDSIFDLCSGPGKLTQALAINGSVHGQDFFSLENAALLLPMSTPEIIVGKRIGITKSAELEWRFLVEGSRFISAPNGKSPPQL